MLSSPWKRSPKTNDSPSFPQLITAVSPLDSTVIIFWPIGILTIIIAIIISTTSAFATVFHFIFLRSQETSQHIANTNIIPSKFNINFIAFLLSLCGLI